MSLEAMRSSDIANDKMDGGSTAAGGGGEGGLGSLDRLFSILFGINYQPPIMLNTIAPLNGMFNNKHYLAAQLNFKGGLLAKLWEKIAAHTTPISGPQLKHYAVEHYAVAPSEVTPPSTPNMGGSSSQSINV